jgi:hypothetical protein
MRFNFYISLRRDIVKPYFQELCTGGIAYFNRFYGLLIVTSVEHVFLLINSDITLQTIRRRVF